MAVISTRRDGRRESHRGVGKRLPLRRDGSAAPRGRACRQRTQRGRSPGSENWCLACNSGKSSLGWSERFGPTSALLTQKIAYSTLSVKLWRPPFMDLEISLRVSTFACRADISQGQKTGGPPFSSPWTLSSQCKRTHSWDPSLLWACLLYLHSAIYKYARGV